MENKKTKIIIDTDVIFEDAAKKLKMNPKKLKEAFTSVFDTALDHAINSIYDENNILKPDIDIVNIYLPRIGFCLKPKYKTTLITTEESNSIMEYSNNVDISTMYTIDFIKNVNRNSISKETVPYIVNNINDKENDNE